MLYKVNLPLKKPFLVMYISIASKRRDESTLNILHNCVLMKQKQKNIWQRIGEGNVTIEEEIGVMWPWAKKWQWPPEAGRNKEWILPESCQWKHSLLVALFYPNEIDFWSSGLQNSEGIRFCCFKQPIQW